MSDTSKQVDEILKQAMPYATDDNSREEAKAQLTAIIEKRERGAYKKGWVDGGIEMAKSVEKDQPNKDKESKE
jgi:hypothetical protein